MFAALTNLKVLAAIATLGAGIGLSSQTAKADYHHHGGFGISLNLAAPVCTPAPVYATPVYTAPVYTPAPVVTYAPAPVYTYAPAPVYVRPAPVIVTGGWYYHHGYHGRHW